jgi:glycosyltransferase involved in cell wall biosynthesis
VQEENSLWGGVKVVFEQAEALQERGHEIIILSKDGPPNWYDVRVPLRRVKSFSPASIPESDFVIGTFWTTIRPVVEAEKGCPVHLCQGYEGAYSAYASHSRKIEEVYHLPILTLTVHEPLSHFLWERFRKKAHTVGQGVDHRVFYPEAADKRTPPWRILLPGPYEVDWKGVGDGLLALGALKTELPLWVVRVSQFPKSTEEEQLGVTDEYHHHLSAGEMRALYHSCDVLLAPSWTQEGFGLPVLEAMACGVPVAMSNIPSFRGFAPGTDWAFFFAERDIAGMQSALRQLLKNRALRTGLQSRGLEVARAYSFTRVAERIERVFLGGGEG